MYSFVSLLQLNKQKRKVVSGVNGGPQGRRHGFKGGGDNFASGASEKNFFDPPTLRLPGGTEINMVVLNLLIGMA